ncbi:MAG: hypothetical protein K2F79_04485 [Muribaculaceae bacterium]|nr:hypothetical protein [Muribaculaceae bacterium]
MIRKAIFLLSLVAAIATAFPAAALQKVGNWTLYPTAGPTYSDVVDANGKTYMLNSGALFSLDHSDNELYAYNSQNKLSDQSQITGIYYNRQKGYLVATYETGNVDLIYDNGKVVNMADIKDAVLTTSHRINDIAFADGKILAGTEFGIVIFDDEKHYVLESGLFNVPVPKVFSWGDHIGFLTNAKSPYTLYTAPADGRHTQLSYFTCNQVQIYTLDIAAIGSNGLIHNSGNTASVRGIGFEDGSLKGLGVSVSGLTTALMPVNSGVMAITSGEFVLVGDDLTVTRSPRDTQLRDGDLFISDGLNSVWQVIDSRIARYDASSQPLTQLMSPYILEGISPSVPAMLNWDSDHRRLYASNYALSHYYSCAVSAYGNEQVKVSVIDADGMHNVGPVYKGTGIDAAYDNNGTSGQLRIGGPSRLAVDPDDPELYYVATTHGTAITAIKNGKIIKTFAQTDIPLNSIWTHFFIDVRIDNEGNLWVAQAKSTADRKSYAVLPAAKRKNLASVTINDWIVPNLPADYLAARDSYITFLKKNPRYAYGSAGYVEALLVIDNNGTPSNFSDDRTMLHTSLSDDSGKALELGEISSMVEDKNGALWGTYNKGVFLISDPSQGMSSGLHVKFPIVARNDGTNLGDYLLDGEKVYQVAVDNSNRKWFATETSGVYLANADGTKILQHFTSDNSALPSNTVYSVACDPYSNKVYFGTSAGLVAYDSDSAPSADDYSDVYAYPNPVRPDYNGWITVTGLMENSLVKIADAAGNVFFQGSSEGGMIVWDGCDPSGKRVRTGVYFVFASQNSDGSSSGCVTKIMVVN